MASRAIVDCICGFRNDVTAEAKAKASKSQSNWLVMFHTKCKKCQAPIYYGPFDPLAAKQGIWP